MGNWLWLENEDWLIESDEIGWLFRLLLLLLGLLLGLFLDLLKQDSNLSIIVKSLYMSYCLSNEVNDLLLVRVLKLFL